MELKVVASMFGVVCIAFPQVLGGDAPKPTGLAENDRMRMLGFAAAFASFGFGAVDSESQAYSH